MKRTCAIIGGLMLTQNNFVRAYGSWPDEEEIIIEKPVTQELNGESWFEHVVDKESKTVKGENGWFVAFYAPHCQYSLELGHKWNELAKDTQGELNVA